MENRKEKCENFWSSRKQGFTEKDIDPLGRTGREILIHYDKYACFDCDGLNEECSKNTMTRRNYGSGTRFPNIYEDDGTKQNFMLSDLDRLGLTNGKHGIVAEQLISGARTNVAGNPAQ